MEIIILVGSPGSGKSTVSNTYGHIRINQDEQGKDGHLTVFKTALEGHHDILIDRMNFSKEQRERYLKPAREAGYKTKIIVLHENYDTCLERMKKRENHPTIKDEATAKKVLNFFFSKYERVEDSEADEIKRIWPEGNKPLAIICDLDGTLCNIEHRLKFVHPESGQKKNWMAFQENLVNDTINDWCAEIITHLGYDCDGDPINKIVLCSGRTNNYRTLTKNWLKENNMQYNNLFMRYNGDYRQDYIAKEILLDFEILTRYTPYFFIDDRQQVVDLWRKRGYVCLQCAPGNF